jgi:uncharacterized lipoprotein NlpE involved in copper resistance
MAALVILGLGSCLSNKIVDNDHNARNCLDWEGVYNGKIPLASGVNIETRIRLNGDQSFEIMYKYIDFPDRTVIWEGSFQWDDMGDIITIDIIDAPTHYRVGSNKLIQLDDNKNMIKGKLADSYVLKKEF